VELGLDRISILSCDCGNFGTDFLGLSLVVDAGDDKNHAESEEEGRNDNEADDGALHGDGDDGVTFLNSVLSHNGDFSILFEVLVDGELFLLNLRRVGVVLFGVVASDKELTAGEGIKNGGAEVNGTVSESLHESLASGLESSLGLIFAVVFLNPEVNDNGTLVHSNNLDGGSVDSEGGGNTVGKGKIPPSA